MEELLRALQKRGFLALMDKGEILLHRDSPGEDLHDLEEGGLTLTPLKHEYWRCRLSFGNFGPNEIINTISHIPVAHSQGLSGAIHPPVAAKQLESGIALFTKVLWVYRIHTLMACEGHEEPVHPQAGCPKVWFQSNAVKSDARACLESLRQQLMEMQQLEFRYSPEAETEWCNQWLEIHPRPVEMNHAERVTSLLDHDEHPSREQLWRQIVEAAAAMLTKTTQPAE